MRKLVNLLVRKADMSHDEFRTYWLEEHAPMAADLPGVRTYATSLPADPEKSAYDGIAELYIEDGSSVGEVFASDVGQEIQADTANFTDEEAGAVLIVDETVQFDADE